MWINNKNYSYFRTNSDNHDIQALNGGLLLLDIDKLRAQPEIIAPEYFRKMIQEFHYIPMTDQVYIFF